MVWATAINAFFLAYAGSHSAIFRSKIRAFFVRAAAHAACTSVTFKLLNPGKIRVLFFYLHFRSCQDLNLPKS
jgi:hypothetical protein